MAKVKTGQLYLAVAGWDIGAGHDILGTIFLLSEEEPNKELVEDYLDKISHRYVSVYSLQKLEIKDCYHGKDGVTNLTVSDDPNETIQWVNDIGEMIRRAYKKNEIVDFKFEEGELEKILDGEKAV
jgi:hypothetical protein